METFGNAILQKYAMKFYCKYCDYGTCRKSSYDDHLLSAKHQKLTNGNIMEPCGNANLQKICNSKHSCENCEKEFKNRSGLWKHKQKCVTIEYTVETTIQKNEITDKELIMMVVKQNTELMKENSEFKQMMFEQNNKMFELAKNAGHNNITNNNTNNNTNNFNLNLFLNETCKNAMNIMDFVSQLQVGIKDLEETGRIGFAEGISKMIINGLKQMDISDRPIHCSDSKREIVYIKDKNQWSKEDEDKTILTTAIKHVVHKNMKQISEWTKEHPEYNDSESRQNDKYLRIVSESMSGSSQEETKKNYNKIIKNITKEILIDKTI
jgi:hypothetical protein